MPQFFERPRRTLAGVGLCTALAACTGAGPEPLTAPQTGTPPRIGMANPASQFCLAQGGSLRTVRTSAGEHALCLLPNGQEVEEWTFFREKGPRP